MIAMIDMGIGNLRSVLEAFRRVGSEVVVTARPEDIERASAVILPGVGAFGDGMASLRQQGLADALRRNAIDGKKPLIGICLGMQLLAEEGEEHGNHKGLGLVPSRVVRLRPTGPEFRVPNMGWCDVTFSGSRGILFDGLRDGESFYFAHSYHLQCSDQADVAATIEYGGSCLTAAIQRENIFGVQFHPEKSQDAGLNVLASFLRYVEREIPQSEPQATL
jgi:glutamine amidotransferase